LKNDDQQTKKSGFESEPEDDESSDGGNSADSDASSDSNNDGSRQQRRQLLRKRPATAAKDVPEPTVRLTEIQRQRQAKGWVFVGGTDALNPSVGAVQIPPTLKEDFVSPALPPRRFRLKANTAVWGALGWTRPREYRICKGSVRKLKAFSSAANLISKRIESTGSDTTDDVSQAPSTKLGSLVDSLKGKSLDVQRHDQLLFYYRPQHGFTIPRNTVDPDWVPPGAQSGSVWPVSSEFPERPRKEVVADIDSDDFDSDEEGEAELRTARADVAMAKEKVSCCVSLLRVVGTWP